MEIRSSPETGKLQICAVYPTHLVPPHAVPQLLKTVTSHLTCSIAGLHLPNDEESKYSADLSKLNWPSLGEPPSRSQPFDGDHDGPILLHSAFTTWAERAPQTQAIDFISALADSKGPAEHHTLTYGALNTAATRLAAHIRQSVSTCTGPRHGQFIIPVYISTSVELYLSYLAVLKAGFAFCPIPLDAPASRIAEILSDLSSPVILGVGDDPSSRPWGLEHLQPAWIDVTAVSRWRDLSNTADHANVEELFELKFQPPTIADNDLAYLMYTSGSTGKPKGVQVTHKAVSCSIESHASSIPLPSTNSDGFRWFQFANPTFDPSLMEIFVTLSSGGTLCSAPRELMLTDLEGALNEARATIMMATPSLAGLIRPSELLTLKHLWTMGESLSQTVIDKFAQDFTLVNAYGPTEGAINCTFLGPVENGIRGSIIGGPLPTCSMLVLDPNSNNPSPVPIGCVGELALTGPQVSMGYLNREAETAKAFVDSSEFGRIYRTGDMARVVWGQSGELLIDFLGRMLSDQAKLSGRRVELGEIESLLAAVDGVAEVVTVVVRRDEETGSERVVACLVSDGQSDADKRDLVDRCCQTVNRHLISYMRPSTYLFLQKLPRLTSGKTDRKSIGRLLLRGEDTLDIYQSDMSAPAGDEQQWGSSNNEVRSVVVEALAQAVGEKASAIKPGASLHALGLDSLGAMKLLQTLRDNSIHGLGVADVLRAQTPLALVSLAVQSMESTELRDERESNRAATEEALRRDLKLFSERSVATCAERLKIDEADIEKVLPTTATQSGMLASYLRSSAASTPTTRSYIYHSVMSLKLEADLDRLKQAWDAVIQSYDSFRTVFCWLDDDLAPFAQCILDPKASRHPGWNIYAAVKGDTQPEGKTELALRTAERNIDIQRHPWQLSLVYLEDQVCLILSMFHGIFDGGSLQLLLDDVSAVYTGQEPLPRTSLDHIVDHHFMADHAATAEFWNAQFEGYVPVDFPSLSSTRPPASPASHAVEVFSQIGYDQLKQGSKMMATTPLSVIQAAWSSILLAYTGASGHDVVFGSVVSGRLDAKSEVCIGPTFTTVPIRLDLHKIPKAGEYFESCSVARHLASLNTEAMTHLQPRLGSVVTAEGRLPYDTLLAYQDFSAKGTSPAIWKSIHHPAMVNDFAVMIEVWPGDDLTLTLRATFSERAMDRAAAEIMLAQMDTIIASILNRPGGNFLDTPAIDDERIKAGLDLVAPSPSTLSDDLFLHSEFEKHVESNPDALALIFKRVLADDTNAANVSWTYRELNSRAQALAAQLHSGDYELRPGSVIPICIQKSPALYVAILAILKAGCAWCPIDVSSPPQRRSNLIARTGARVLLVSGADSIEAAELLPEGCQPLNVVPFTDQPLSDLSSNLESLRNGTKSSNTAYLIWTSGTTGAPKGVPITHTAGVASIASLMKTIPLGTTGTPRMLQLSDSIFDVSIQDVFYTWSSGGTLISASREIMLGSFPQLANETKATHVHLTPAFAAGIRRSACKTLEVITMIGEKLPQPVADDWGRDMRAFNTYGPAEATIVSTVREFGNEHSAVKSANIGWPLNTVSVFVTNGENLLMKHAVGELALGGPQLSPGYLAQDEITKAKYRWNEKASQILYYTGDLVRMLSDGSLEYLHRVDDIVKLGGIRVELSEISYTLMDSHPLIDTVETLVLNRPDRPTNVVVSFLVAPQAVVGTDHSDEAIVDELGVSIASAALNTASSSLPPHMIPSCCIVVSSIPRTQSGKTDRRALQAIYIGLDIDGWDQALGLGRDSSLQDNSDSPSAPLSGRIISTVSAFANVKQSLITGASRLATLGIDSIRAIRLASRLNENGDRISVQDVLQCRTVADLVNRVGFAPEDQGQDRYDMEAFNSQWHDAVADAVTGDFHVAPATAIQEGTLSETMGAMAMYWSNHFFALDPSVDISRLKQAWNAVCQSNAALRTGFVPIAALEGERVDGSSKHDLLQVLYNQHDIDWVYTKCTRTSYRSVLEERVNHVMSKHQNSYFIQPPWAITVLATEDEQVMVLTLHHSIHDGPSLDFIKNDVYNAYESSAPIRPELEKALSLVVPTPTQKQKTNEFWRAELEPFANADPPTWAELTGKRVRNGIVPTRSFISESIPLAESASSLRAKAAGLGVSSMASVLRAAWGVVLLAYLGDTATVFAETLSDRVLDAEMAEVVGPFISVVPVPFHAKGTVRELFDEQNRTYERSWTHRHVHPREVRVALKRAPGQSVYPAVFTFHPSSGGGSSSRTPIWEEREDELGLNVEHSFALNVSEESDGTLTLVVSCLSTLMSPTHLSLFGRHIDAVVSAMLEHPDEPVREISRFLPTNLLSISSPDPSSAIKESVPWNPAHWLEAHAKTHPDWPAVEVATSITDEGVVKECMSYAKLNSEANKVAAYLVSRGFHNRLIAVCGPPSLLLYPITLGIFKSGNAYMPIDEGLPEDRKAVMIEDGNSPIVFTESSLHHKFANIPHTCEAIRFDDQPFQDIISQMPSEDQSYHANSDDPAYVLFTSGSTGKPKGVVVTRGNLSSFLQSWSDLVRRVAPKTLDLGGRGRFLALANKAFDPHLAEMFGPWCFGMATCSADRTLLLDDLQGALVQWDITHASFVPSILDQMNILPPDTPKLKYISVGGEKISQRVLDTWVVDTGVSLVNAYGPTEVTIGCTFAHVNQDTNMRNIGTPLSACTCHVLVPDSLTYALLGQVGELCFTGSIVAKGYMDRPDAKGFVTGPNGEHMYRTGDMGRMMVDGSIEYFGRSDDQTKIRGQRLELGEVSEVVRASSPVAVDVVSMIVKHPALARSQLVSFVARSVRNRGDELAIIYSDIAALASDLRRACEKKLPVYMVPEIVLPLTNIPLARLSGKADSKELRRIFGTLTLDDVLRGNSLLPASDNAVVDRALTAEEDRIVEEIARMGTVDGSLVKPRTNIFEIGIDSLGVIGLSVRLRAAGYDATVAAIMNSPVIEQLALLPKREDIVTSSQADDKDWEQRLTSLTAKFVEMHPEPLNAQASVRPCLPLQEGLVARSMNNDGDELYVNHVLLKLAGNVQPELLRSAWSLAASKNEILRTAFAPLDSQIVQVVFPAEGNTLHWDEQEFDGVEQGRQGFTSQYRRIARNIIQHISTTPPVRFNVASTQSGQPFLLLVSIHHGLYDGESFGMLLDDVAKHYTRVSPPERGSPSAFIQHVHSQSPEKSKSHWKQELSGCSPTLFRNDTSDIGEPSTIDRTSASALSDVKRYAASLRTTVPSLMQSIFALLLADSINSSDITYGLVLSGRSVSVPGAESVLLPCITTIPARLNTRGLNTVEEVIAYVQRTSAKSLGYQHTSLRYIQQWVNSGKPVFDCLFSFVKTTQPVANAPWEELASEMPMEYPLAMEVEADDAQDQLYLHCGFTSSFGSHSRVNNLVAKMDIVLSTIINGESLSLESFNLSQTSIQTNQLQEKVWKDDSWTQLEQSIRQTVADFCSLGVDVVSKGTSFLRLGVDSVTAIQLSKQLRLNGVAVTSRDIMRYSCVGALAQNIAKTASVPDVTKATRNSEIPDLSAYASHVHLLNSKDMIETTFMCTPLQSSMITQTLGLSGAVYVHPHIVQLSETCNLGNLKSALQNVIDANDILRTSFHFIQELGNQWVGAVHSLYSPGWHETIISPDGDIDATALNVLRLDEESAFAIPPIRAAMIHRSNERFFALVTHHSLYDGTSLRFIFEDLILAYQGLPLPTRSPFADSALRISQGQDEACGFWTESLRGYKVTEVPPLPEAESSSHMFFSEARVELDISAIANACQALEVTVRTAALLSYAKVIARLTSQDDVVFGHVLARRSVDTLDEDQTIGPLFNTVAQRIDLGSKVTTNREMLQRLQRFSADSQDYQHASLRAIQTRLREARQLDTASVFDTLFVFQKSAEGPGGLSEMNSLWTPFNTVEALDGQAQYKLNVEVDHGADGVVVRASCQGQFLSQRNLDDALKAFSHAFCETITHPSRSVTAYPAYFDYLPSPLAHAAATDIGLVKSEEPSHEPIVRKVLSEISGLPVDALQPNSSIFSIGLDSVSAIRVASELRLQGLAAGVADILQGSTIRGISSRLRFNPKKQDSLQRPLVPDIDNIRPMVLEQVRRVPEEVEQILPCLSGQMYHLASWLKSRRTLFEPAWPYACSQRIEVERMQDAWAQLRQRNSILRTCFAAVSPSRAVQVVLKAAAHDDGTFQVISSSECLVEAGRTWAKIESIHPSTLDSPPVRLRLIKAADRDGFLLIVNHASYDAWSMPMIVQQLADIYLGVSSKSAPEFASFVNFTTQTARSLEQESYWESVLAGSSPTLLGPSNTNGTYTNGAGSSHRTRQLFVGSWEKIPNLLYLERSCQAAGISLQSVTLLAVSRILARLAEVSSPTFGLYQSGRSAAFAGIEGLAGPCLNVTPFTVRDVLSNDSLMGSDTLKAVRSIQESLADLIPYEQASLREILTNWANKHPATPSLFNAWVNLLWTGQSAAQPASQALFEPVPIGVPTDFILSTAPASLATEKTSVDELDTSYLPDQNIFIDIGPDPRTQTIGFGVRVEGGLMGESETRDFIDAVANEIEGLVRSLEN